MEFSRRSMRYGLELLNNIKQDKERVDLLLTLQKLMIRQLIKIEQRIVRLKKARKRLTKAKKIKRPPSEVHKVKIIKSLIDRLDLRIEEYHHQRFLWRCLGDGIAYVYQSKYSLKHLYFDKNNQPKEESGFLLGKTGFKKEYKTLVKGIQMGVPVVLSDLTNVLRYGDLYALAGSEPVPIEIKSSENRNARTNRQLEQLNELNEFFSSDEVNDFRGMPLTKRVSLADDDISHESVINDCITNALNNNSLAISIPENGLRYFAFTTEWLNCNSSVFEQYLGEPKPNLMMVHIPCDKRLLPSSPFVLSMELGNALRFMEGDINVAVEIDLQEVKSIFLSYGLHVIFLLNGDCAFQVMHDKNDIFKGAFRVSEMAFLRVATEFISLKRFVENKAHIAKEFSLSNVDITFDESALATLKWWGSAKCYLET